MIPGTFGVSHGSGLAGELIRTATQSWAGHAFIYIGNGQLVEGQPPVARTAVATEHSDAIWAEKMPITPEQSAKLVARAQALVGVSYDWPAYVGFALEVTGLRSGKQLDPVFKSDQSRVCSGLVADCFAYAGIPLTTGDVNLVSPADLYNLIAKNGWA